MAAAVSLAAAGWRDVGHGGAPGPGLPSATAGIRRTMCFTSASLRVRVDRGPAAAAQNGRAGPSCLKPAGAWVPVAFGGAEVVLGAAPVNFFNQHRKTHYFK